MKIEYKIIKWHSSSVGQSARLIPGRSLVRTQSMLFLLFKNKKTETMSFRFFIRYDRRYEENTACAVQQSLIAQADLMNQWPPVSKNLNTQADCIISSTFEIANTLSKALKCPRIRVLTIHFCRYFILSKSTQKPMKWIPVFLKSFYL